MRAFVVFFALSVFSAGAFAQGVTTPEGQVIKLQGQANTRDLGGYVGAGGKRVKAGLLYRADDMSKLTESDVAELASRKIVYDFDLRSDAEVASAPDKAIPGVTYVRLPLFRDISGSQTLMADILSGKTEGRAYLTEMYATIGSFDLASWKALFALLTQGGPVLWHCTAGKDRAGQTAALVLSALGVDRETIIRDYLKSNETLKAQNEATVADLKAKGIPGERLMPLLGVERSYIVAFLDAIDAKYGSMEKFLSGTLGADIPRLRAIYLQ